MAIGIGLIGFGYWGPNLVRNFVSAGGARVVAVADKSEAARDAVARAFPGLATYESPDDLLKRNDVEAVLVATPVSSHHALAAAALDAGKHVLVEKPLCRTSEEVIDLIARAERARRVLMVDHTFLFNGAVQSIASIIGRNELGRVCYVDSTRVNLGLFQPDVNCLWDLAPHDLSIINHIIDSEVIDVQATGYGHMDLSRLDMVFMTIHYADNIVAHFNWSWMSPVKIRRFMIGGIAKMLIWDDLDQDQKIKIYDHGIEFQPQEQRNTIIPQYRIGDIYSPRVSRREALAGVADHFLKVIRGEEHSIMDGRKGLQVVRLLERAQSRLDASMAVVASARSQIVGKAAS
jgi:predicted dehydrogenase